MVSVPNGAPRTEGAPKKSASRKEQLPVNIQYFLISYLQIFTFLSTLERKRFNQAQQRWSQFPASGNVE